MDYNFLHGDRLLEYGVGYDNDCMEQPLQWFEHPKPLICVTWILSLAITLAQCLLVCYLEFDPGTLSFHRFCPNKIYTAILNAFGLINLILIILPYLFIIREIIRLKNMSSQVRPVVTYNAQNCNVRIGTPNSQGLQSDKAEILVGLQVVLTVVILITTNAILAFVSFGHAILACIVSHYATIILCTYTSVLSLIFCEDIRLGVKALAQKLLCNSNDL
uniref:G-protein coupled receptors family 1 profile domain-containing protein n=1 Tax=Romanomermis culicivorax TaxID=13658 RepID=A0A915J9F2_ROMCU